MNRTKTVGALLVVSLISSTMMPVTALAASKSVKFKCPPVTRDLHAGDSGDEVLRMQGILSIVTYEGNDTSSTALRNLVKEQTGTFDSETVKTLKRYQERTNQQFGLISSTEIKKNKLSRIPDAEVGSVGPSTRALLSYACKSVNEMLDPKNIAAGNDALIKAALSVRRASAELYWDAHNDSYGVVNTCDSGVFSQPSYSNVIAAGGSPVCRSNGEAYMTYAKLSKGYYCVDSTGNAVVMNKKPNKGAYSCNGKAAKTAPPLKLHLDKKGYADKNYSFSIKFPKGWKLAKTSDSYYRYFTFTSKDKQASIRIVASSGLWGPNAAGVQNYLTAVQKGDSQSLTNYQFLRNVTRRIGSTLWPGYITVWNAPGERSYEKELYTGTANEYAYEISAVAPQDLWDTYQPLFNKTIDTISFP